MMDYSWQQMWARPGRTALTLLSIVIGVAAVGFGDLGHDRGTPGVCGHVWLAYRPRRFGSR